MKNSIFLILKRVLNARGFSNLPPIRFFYILSALAGKKQPHCGKHCVINNFTSIIIQSLAEG